MKLETQLKHYFHALHEAARRGDAREESFYSVLQGFLSDCAREQGHQQVHVTVNPRPTEGGNPDFRIWDGDQKIIGYVEAKQPGTDLRMVADSDQLGRYCSTFPNLILTDFCEFWLFRDGELTDKVRAGRAMVLTDLAAPPPPEDVEGLQCLLTTFLGFSLPRSFDAPTLARELARRTRFMDRIVLAQLRAEQKAKKGYLRGFFQAFRKFLLAQLVEEQFADLYSQTITYGLFAARTRAGDDFNRKNAVKYIPRTIGVLHDVFEFLSWGELSEDLAWIVDDIAHVLAIADAGQILDRYYKQGKGADPIVHFYETFLAEYDPAERERRGVYYTPEPVVGYIVRSLHRLLQSEFRLDDGLAAKGVKLLDPAAGTMTFVARAVEQAVETFVERYGEGGRDSFVRDRILPNFYGFELMMAPYAVGHLKMGFYLDELGHRLQADERFQLYLTNALEMEKKEQSDLPGMAALTEEAEHAYRVKQQVSILVILGNPPYSGHSPNTGEWIRGLIEDYKKPAPELKNPGQAKWLQNDYVKFIRFAQWKIDQAGHGIIGMITSHSWLDNPTFRGMRWHLMQSFDEIRVLDLHGSSKEAGATLNGGRDENVFEITQGVAISTFLKRRKSERSSSTGPSNVYHAELWGARDQKYDWLNAHDVSSTEWQAIDPQAPYFLFRPFDRSRGVAYDSFTSIPEIFSPNGSPAPGIVTTHDEFAISWTPEEAAQKVQRLLATTSEEQARKQFKLCSQSQWSYKRAKEELAEGRWRQEIVPVLYRPFDIRYTVFNRNVAVHRRERVMRHMLAGENIALITSRLTKGESFRHAQATRGVAEVICMSPKTSNNGFIFPLYLYPLVEADDGQRGIAQARKINLHPRLLPLLSETYGRSIKPEELFHYVFAVLYTPFYRNAYSDFLAIDFPRIPFPTELPSFETMATMGERLVALQLLESPELYPPSVRFEGQGDNVVERKRSDGFGYDRELQRVAINTTQHFMPIPPALWEYHIGGYQVLEKWIKDRKDRQLSTDDIQTYCRIATALSKMIGIEKELDDLYSSIEESLLVISLDNRRDP